jgi:TonB family protein
MTLALPAARLPAAIAASLAFHAALAAALAVVAGAERPGAGARGSEPHGLSASLRTFEPARTSAKRAAASPRAKARSLDRPGLGASLPMPYYHPASDLTEPPLPLAAIQPRFPEGASATGRVKIRLYISEHGSVDAVRITEAEPVGEFEQAAVQAFTEARFRPGYKDGTAVRSQLALEVRFGEPLPMPSQPQNVAALRLPENPNAYDAPDRVGIKTRRAR